MTFRLNSQGVLSTITHVYCILSTFQAANSWRTQLEWWARYDRGNAKKTTTTTHIFEEMMKLKQLAWHMSPRIGVAVASNMEATDSGNGERRCQAPITCVHQPDPGIPGRPKDESKTILPWFFWFVSTLQAPLEAAEDHACANFPSWQTWTPDVVVSGIESNSKTTQRDSADSLRTVVRRVPTGQVCTSGSRKVAKTWGSRGNRASSGAGPEALGQVSIFLL